MENRSSFFLLTTSVGYSQIKYPEFKIDSGFSTFNSELSFKEGITSEINHGRLI
ncbi:hypothetical protein NIES25_25970 [Nostoc linckia NIES-25]|nr:hypothetical protein NIES25_25970 [Nostoc linckia NIES-25]